MAYPSPSPEPESTKPGERHTRILLLPLSTSATQSLRLPENQACIAVVSLAGLPSGAFPARLKSRTKTRAFQLCENLDQPYFVLGSDRSCQIRLQTTIDECWVNMRHCTLFTLPDDEDDAILLRNSSTSRFTLKGVCSRKYHEVLPGERLRVCPGSMHITLGAGLEFLLRVFPSSSSNTHAAMSFEVCELLSGKAFAQEPTLRRKKSLCKDSVGTRRNSKRIKAEVASLDEIPCKGSHSEIKTNLTSQRELVAETGLTCVFKLRRLGRVVAAKMCRKPDVEDAVYMWENERKVLQALRHHNIAQLLDFRAADLTLFLEYIEGRDLSQYVDTENFSIIKEELQSQVWLDISSALEYIHGEGIIHHDIKPNNIILGHHGRGAVLCDFGLSTFEPHYSDGGSPSYVPPELLLRQRGRPSDIWAFGVTMLFVLKHIPLPSNGWPIRKLLEDSNVRKNFMAWWDQIDIIRKKLPRRMTALRQMLIFNPQQRISASTLHAILKKPAEKVKRKQKRLVLKR